MKRNAGSAALGSSETREEFKRTLQCLAITDEGLEGRKGGQREEERLKRSQCIRRAGVVGRDEEEN